MDGRTLEKRYDQVLQEAQFLRGHCLHLERELNACRPELHRADQTIDRLRQRNQHLARENKLLKRRLADLTAQLKQKPKPTPPPFVKANVAEKTRKAWSILAGGMRTAEQQGRDVVETLKTLLRAAWAGKNLYLLTDTS